MRLKFICLLVLALVGASIANAQKNEDVLAYITTYKELAIEEMLRTGIPASITLAQGIHETQAGKSDLVLKSNNHFGIKCKTGWDGEKVYHDDDIRGECFRSYSSANDSYIDHSDFLKNSPRYSFLFNINAEDYKSWAYGLKKAGYATNSKYSQILIKLIETYDLQRYSLIALGKLPPEDDMLVKTKSNSEAVGPAAPVAVVMEEPAIKKPEYPSREFIINQTRVIYAKAGTSLLAIAQKYDIDLNRILDFNHLQNEEVLIEDQLVFLQRKRKVGNNEFHIMEQGENIYGISQSEGIRVESLMELNHLAKGMEPAIGEKLYLRHKAAEQPKLKGKEIVALKQEIPQTIEPEVLKHTVRSKETLYAISKKYGVTEGNIVEWNNLKNSHLKKGQELIIYKN